MNPLQSKIEQTAKEYLSYKAIADKEAEIAKKEKENVAKKSLTLLGEDLYSYAFDTFTPLQALTQDMLQIKTKLYNQIELVKDVVEIPKEITDLVLDYNPIYTYAILGDEKKLIDEKSYTENKKNYISFQMAIGEMSK